MLWLFLKTLFQVLIYKPCTHNFLFKQEWTEKKYYLGTELQYYNRLFQCTKCNKERVIRDGKIMDGENKYDRIDLFFTVMMLCMLSIPFALILWN